MGHSLLSRSDITQNKVLPRPGILEIEAAVAEVNTVMFIGRRHGNSCSHVGVFRK